MPSAKVLDWRCSELKNGGNKIEKKQKYAILRLKDPIKAKFNQKYTRMVDRDQ